MKIVKFNNKHLKAVFELSNLSLGKNYLTKEYLKKHIEDDKSFGFVFEKNNLILGFTLIESLSPIQLRTIVLKDKDWFYDQVKSHQTITLIKQTVVAPNFINKGIGSKLVDYSIKEINAVPQIQLSTVWKKENDNPMSSLLLKNGFSFLKSINNYWEKDSLIKNYECPICGLPPCKCSTDVYIKKKH